MKRLASGLMALTLAFSLCAPAMAATSNYAMEIQVNGSSDATVARGSQVTVTLTLSQPGESTFDLYSMQDYVCFDPDYFEFVEDSIQVYTVGEVPAPVFSASAIAFPAGEPELNRVYVNRASNTAQSVPSGLTVLTFQLTALQNGTTSIYHDKVEVFQTPGQLYPCGLSSATVTIQDNAGGGTGGGGSTGGGGGGGSTGGGGGGSVGGGTTGDVETPDDPLAGFVDVAQNAWYRPAVEYACSNGLMAGTSATTFSPDMTTSRGMIVTILYSLEGKPQTASVPFEDVSLTDWYGHAVAWAAANSVVSGYSSTSFGPNDSITREQMATILYSYARYKGCDVSARADLSGYKDMDQISAYARSSMEWACAEGLISGVGDNMLSPQGNATRAQVAQILMQFCENVLK